MHTSYNEDGYEIPEPDDDDYYWSMRQAECSEGEYINAKLGRLKQDAGMIPRKVNYQRLY